MASASAAYGVFAPDPVGPLAVGCGRVDGWDRMAEIVELSAAGYAQSQGLCARV